MNNMMKLYKVACPKVALAGCQLGDLTVLHCLGADCYGVEKWLCQCQCGRKIKYRGPDLREAKQDGRVRRGMRCSYCKREKQNQYQRTEHHREYMRDYQNKRKGINTNKKRGHIYLVRVGESLHYKIGYAKNLKTRIAVVQTHSPTGVHLIHSIFAGWSIERTLRDDFVAYHTRGEWFVFPDGVVDEVIARMDELEAG